MLAALVHSAAAAPIRLIFDLLLLDDFDNLVRDSKVLYLQ